MAASIKFESVPLTPLPDLRSPSLDSISTLVFPAPHHYPIRHEEADITTERSSSTDSDPSSRRFASQSDTTVSTDSERKPSWVDPLVAPFEYQPMYPSDVKTSFVNDPTMIVDLPIYPPSGREAYYPSSGSNRLFDWIRCVHPNGGIYSYHQDTRTVVARNEPITPDCWRGGLGSDAPYTERGSKAMRTIEELWTSKTDLNIFPESDCELFIQLSPPTQPDPNPRCSTVARYYFVNWDKRTVFWLKKVITPKAAAGTAHAAVMLESMFWAHVDNFPVHHPLPPNARGELEVALAYQVVNESTQEFSPSIWKVEKAESLMSCVQEKSVKNSIYGSTLVDSPANSKNPSRSNTKEFVEYPLGLSVEEGTSNAIVARLWLQICEERRINLYGEANARLRRTETRKYSMEEPSKLQIWPWAQRAISFLMFNGPSHFSNELHEVFVDEILYERHWESYVEKICQPEWRDNSVVAAVILAGNVGFIALGTNDPSNASTLSPTWKELSISSMLFSLATILSTMLLIQSYQRIKALPAEKANDYMIRCSRWPLGIFGMAMLFSMPFFMLMVSLFVFAGAVLKYSFGTWSTSSSLPLLLTTIVPIVAALLWQSIFLGGRRIHTWTWSWPSIVQCRRQKAAAADVETGLSFSQSPPREVHDLQSENYH